MELMRFIVKKNPGELSVKVKRFVDSLKEDEDVNETQSVNI
jgi:hypothetical protein